MGCVRCFSWVDFDELIAVLAFNFTIDDSLTADLDR